jgi:hypothetical protein
LCVQCVCDGEERNGVPMVKMSPFACISVIEFLSKHTQSVLMSTHPDSRFLQLLTKSQPRNQSLLGTSALG